MASNISTNDQFAAKGNNMSRMLKAGEVIRETDEFQFFNSKVWYSCSLIIGSMEKGQTLLDCNVGYYRRPYAKKQEI